MDAQCQRSSTRAYRTPLCARLCAEGRPPEKPVSCLGREQNPESQHPEAKVLPREGAQVAQTGGGTLLLGGSEEGLVSEGGARECSSKCITRYRIPGDQRKAGWGRGEGRRARLLGALAARPPVPPRLRAPGPTGRRRPAPAGRSGGGWTRRRSLTPARPPSPRVLISGRQLLGITLTEWFCLPAFSTVRRPRAMDQRRGGGGRAGGGRADPTSPRIRRPPFPARAPLHATPAPAAPQVRWARDRA